MFVSRSVCLMMFGSRNSHATVSSLETATGISFILILVCSGTNQRRRHAEHTWLNKSKIKPPMPVCVNDMARHALRHSNLSKQKSGYHGRDLQHPTVGTPKQPALHSSMHFPSQLGLGPSHPRMPGLVPLDLLTASNIASHADHLMFCR